MCGWSASLPVSSDHSKTPRIDNERTGADRPRALMLSNTTVLIGGS